MRAMTWPHVHVPHPHLHRRERTTEAVTHHRRDLLAAVVAAWLVVMLGLLVVARATFGMDVAQAWGFAMGVSLYILLFSSFIGGLAWAVKNNRMDDPGRC